MKGKQVVDFIQRKPFVPFDIKSSDGRVYNVDHPEFIHISRGNETLYYNTPEDDRLIFIAVEHIVALEVANRTAA